jgi:hypothetical protein
MIEEAAVEEIAPSTTQAEPAKPAGKKKKEKKSKKK